MHRLILWVLVVISAFGQTEIDLRTQSKSIDFTAAAFTRPIKTGTSLPATCTPGDMFFQTNAPSGLNVSGCVSTNTWALQSGGGGGGGAFTIQNNGTVVGARGVANFISGTGVLNAISDTGSQINIQQSVDTAVIPSKTTAQSGSLWLCNSASGSATAYTCAMSPTLQTYSTGMVLNWKPDVNGSGGATTLNVDTLGLAAVKESDGATNPTSSDIVSGHLYPIWYDGTVFRLPNSVATLTSPHGTLSISGGALDVNAGTGLLTSGGNLSIDTSVTLTKAAQQTGAVNDLVPAGGSATAYTACPTPVISAYSQDQVFFLRPDVTSGTSPTINLCGLGPIALKYDSGGGTLAAIPSGSLRTTRNYLIQAVGATPSAFIVKDLPPTGSGYVATVGAQITAAATITPTAGITHITGATSISTITAPTNLAQSGLGGCLTFIPDSTLTFGAGGNIAAALSATTNVPVLGCYDNTQSKWYLK